jgi:hypothetical protein
MTASTFKTTGECLGLYKATYAYTAQGDDELSMEEDQLVFLMDNSDDECVLSQLNAVFLQTTLIISSFR